MKTALLHGPGDFHVEEVSDPELTPDGAIIRAKAYAICGSEILCYTRQDDPTGRLRRKRANS